MKNSLLLDKNICCFSFQFHCINQATAIKKTETEVVNFDTGILAESVKHPNTKRLSENFLHAKLLTI